VTTVLSRRVQGIRTFGRAREHVLGAYQRMVAGSTAALATRGSDPAQATAQAHGLVYGLVQRQASMMAFVDDFWLLGAVFLCLIPLMFLMKKTRPHKSTDVATH